MCTTVWDCNCVIFINQLFIFCKYTVVFASAWLLIFVESSDSLWCDSGAVRIEVVIPDIILTVRAYRNFLNVFWNSARLICEWSIAGFFANLYSFVICVAASLLLTVFVRLFHRIMYRISVLDLTEISLEDKMIPCPSFSVPIGNGSSSFLLDLWLYSPQEVRYRESWFYDYKIRTFPCKCRFL